MCGLVDLAGGAGILQDWPCRSAIQEVVQPIKEVGVWLKSKIAKAFKRGKQVNFYLAVIGGTPAVTLINPEPYSIHRRHAHTDPEFVFQPSVSPQPIKVNPGETKSWSWNQQDTGGNQVDAGRYILGISLQNQGPLKRDFVITNSFWRSVGGGAKKVGRVILKAFTFGLAFGADSELTELPQLALATSLNSIALDPPDFEYRTTINPGDVLSSWRKRPGFDDKLDQVDSNIRDFVHCTADFFDANIAIWRTIEKIEGAVESGTDNYVRLQCRQFQQLCYSASQSASAFETASDRLVWSLEKPDMPISQERTEARLREVIDLYREQIHEDVPDASAAQHEFLDRAIDDLVTELPEGELSFSEATTQLIDEVQFYRDVLEGIASMSEEELVAEVRETGG